MQAVNILKIHFFVCKLDMFTFSDIKVKNEKSLHLRKTTICI